MVTKKNITYAGKRFIFYLFVSLLAVVCLIPLYWMIRSSFMRSTEIYQMNPFIIWPETMLIENYTDAMAFAPFGLYARNTIIIVLGNLIGTVLTSSMAAFAFSRIRWAGQKICFAIIISTMMLPGAVTLIPQFLIWSRLGLIDTYVPLILPSFLGGGAFNIFLFRQFFMAIPKDLDEAAKIDGARPLRIYAQIILPLSKSAIIVVALFTVLACWNDFFGPIIFLNSKEKFTLAVGLLQFRGDYGTKWNLLMAASTIVTAPCIVLYLIGQKYLIEGVALTGMKA